MPIVTHHGSSFEFSPSLNQVIRSQAGFPTSSFSFQRSMFPPLFERLCRLLSTKCSSVGNASARRSSWGRWSNSAVRRSNSSAMDFAIVIGLDRKLVLPA